MLTISESIVTVHQVDSYMCVCSQVAMDRESGARSIGALARDGGDAAMVLSTCNCPPGGQREPLRTYSAVCSAALDFMTSNAVADAAAVPLQAQGAS